MTVWAVSPDNMLWLKDSEKHGGSLQPDAGKFRRVRKHFSQRPQFVSGSLPSQQTLSPWRMKGKSSRISAFSVLEYPAPSWTIVIVSPDSIWSVIGFELVMTSAS